MKESDKKRIYYDLRHNDVQVEKSDNGTKYKFGRYLFCDYYGYIDIRQTNKSDNTYIRVYDGEWDESIGRNDAYNIWSDVYYKANGKPYDDPYKDVPTDVEIRDLTKTFGKNILKNADEFLPVDMPKYQALRTIVKLRQQLTQQLKEYYTK